MALVIAHNPGPARPAVWTRTRYFVGHRNGSPENGYVQTRVVFPCVYVPTDATHGKLYGYVTGPFRLKTEAMERAGMRPGWTVQQRWTRADGWEIVDRTETRQNALASVALYRSEQPGIPARIRRIWE